MQHLPVLVTISPILLAIQSDRSMHIPTLAKEKDIEINMFVDSGAGGIFIHPKVVIRLRLETK